MIANRVQVEAARQSAGWGGSGAGFDDPLEMLSACHERVEAQLATLEKLVAYLGGKGCDAPAREAARAVLRYFDTAAVLHHRDEEEDLFPLLRRYASRRARHDIGALLDELAREHGEVHAAYLALRASLERVAEGRATRLDPGEVARFAAAYRQHIAREEDTVLPFAALALGPAELVALGTSMAARRGGGAHHRQRRR